MNSQRISICLIWTSSTISFFIVWLKVTIFLWRLDEPEKNNAINVLNLVFHEFAKGSFVDKLPKREFIFHWILFDSAWNSGLTDLVIQFEPNNPIFVIYRREPFGERKHFRWSQQLFQNWIELWIESVGGFPKFPRIHCIHCHQEHVTNVWLLIELPHNVQLSSEPVPQRAFRFDHQVHHRNRGTCCCLWSRNRRTLLVLFGQVSPQKEISTWNLNVEEGEDWKNDHWAISTVLGHQKRG